jgi:phosphatidate cytidylyltransferase
MTRVVSGVALAAAALAAIFLLPFVALRVLACLVASLAADEYVRITNGARPERTAQFEQTRAELVEGRRPERAERVEELSRWIVIAAVVFTCWWSAVPAPLSIVLLAMVVIVWLAFAVLRQSRTLNEAAVDLVAPVYIGAPLGMLVALQTLSGPRATLIVIATIVVSDTAQYYSGRAFGRRPLAPTISPKKTVEGAIGGVICGALFMAIALTFVFPATPIVVRVLLGLVIVFLGIAGDLFESRLKRLAGMKDSSALIPGHGGVLDRIDALLFAIPVFYYMVLQGRVA